MGRMNTFMARILKDVDAEPPSLSRAVGIDEHTALLLNINTGDVEAVGVGTAYVCESKQPAAVCKKETPLTFQGNDPPHYYPRYCYCYYYYHLLWFCRNWLYSS